MFRNTAPNAISQFKKNSSPSQWGNIIVTLIDRLSVDDTIPYFRDLLSFYNSALNPALNIPFASAFSALLNKLYHHSAGERIKELPLANYDLKKLTTTCINSSTCRECMVGDIHVMLDVADKAHKLAWAEYIYSEANKNNLSDIITHSIAIRIFGKARDMQRTESAFATARHLCVEYAFTTAQHLHVTREQINCLYGVMLEACCTNNELERAIDIYGEAIEGGYTDSTIWNIMLQVAGKFGDKEMAEGMLTLMLSDPAWSAATLHTAYKNFNTYFPHQTPITHKAPIKEPANMQNAAPIQLRRPSFFQSPLEEKLPEHLGYDQQRLQQPHLIRKISR